jgi:hypothetical protein
VTDPSFPDATPRRRPKRRRTLWIIVLVAVLLLAAAVVGYLLLLSARGPLLEAREAVEEGRDALIEGDWNRARASFAAGAESFDRGLGRVHNPLTWFASVLPVAGRTADAVIAGAEAGDRATGGALGIIDAVDNLPGGLDALAPEQGRIDVEAVASLSPPLTRAHRMMREAERIAMEAPTTLVPGEVSSTLRTLTREVAEARRAVGAADALVAVLPSFLGADGPRRYFVGAQNPAELRGTGGLIGLYAIATAEDGRLEVGPFQDISDLPSVGPGEIEPPTPDFGELYGRFNATGDFSNINMTPDFPSAATAVERLYERVGGEELDGTILADPEAFALFLEATGPADVPGTDVILDPGDVVSFVTNEAYVLFRDSEVRKDVLAGVVGVVLQRFLSGGGHTEPAAAGRSLIEAVAAGHLLLHAVDATVQAGFERAGVAGRLAEPAGDYAAVVVNNASGSKIDYYARRALAYDVQLRPDGTVEGRLEVTFRNAAPSSGLPAYVIGPHPNVDAPPGENVMIVSAYCAPGCRMDAFWRDGAPAEASTAVELGHPVAITGEGVPSRESRSLMYEWTLPDGWDPETGRYRLTVAGQPTVHPTNLEVRIDAPARIAHGTEGIRVAGDRASWRGVSEDRITFQVELAGTG